MLEALGQGATQGFCEAAICARPLEKGGCAMFTGTVTEVGQILSQSKGEALRLRIAVSPRLAEASSLACDGVRLTVVARSLGDQPWVEVDLCPQTLSQTHFGIGLREGQPLNLERALRLGEEMGGHIVTGHVDGLAEVISVAKGHVLRLRAPQDLAHLIAQKGAVTVNGVSLTVHEVEGAVFMVSLIPATLARTTLSSLRAGDMVNLEVDTLARYVARLGAMGRE